jgi:lipopolysaccharide transport system ATP-binding protein
MHKNTAIKVKNLTKTYKLYDKPIDRLKESLHPLGKKYHKDFYALNNVSFEIKKGETVGIVGKNGSGKSTLLKIITGVLTPTSGRVTIHGKISAILELGAGFNPEMTGLENIYLNTSINGMNKAQTDKKIDEIVAFAELGEFIHQPIKTYSSGMKARLAFAVSINVDPDILIVDEALSVGDAAFARKCFAKMEDIRSKGATILFVSHSEGSIVSLCNRAIWISNGNQIIDGTPKLVTGLYMKHINENKVDKSKIEKEYESLVNNEEEEEEEKTKESKEAKEQNNSKLKICPERNALGVQNSTLKNSSIEEFFNPALKPSSTIYYEEKGAKISNVKITTLDGKEVNMLSQGNQYNIEFKINFLKNIYCVIGCNITDKSGIYLSGAVYPAILSCKEYACFNQDASILMKFNFTASLNENDYFLSCMLVDNEGDEPHKIKDAYMFKILRKSKTSNAFVDLIQPSNLIYAQGK